MGKFANVFKELRIKSGLTQQEMADKLNISRSSIGMYENGEREPSFELLETIADYFNVDMNYLLGKKNCPNTYLRDIILMKMLAIWLNLYLKIPNIKFSLTRQGK